MEPLLTKGTLSFREGFTRVMDLGILARIVAQWSRFAKSETSDSRRFGSALLADYDRAVDSAHLTKNWHACCDVDSLSDCAFSPSSRLITWCQPSGSDDSATIPGASLTAIGFDADQSSGGDPINLAKTGSPPPVATQSSTLGGFVPELAINGDLGDFTHTQGTNAQATWMLNLRRRALIRTVKLNNRTSCCGSRLRDINVEVLALDQSVVFTSPLLNPKNLGYVFPNGPDHWEVNLLNPVVGQFIRVKRRPDPTLAGTGGHGNGDETNVLSLGEVLVLGEFVGWADCAVLPRQYGPQRRLDGWREEGHHPKA